MTLKRSRRDWDLYFIAEAYLASFRSKDPSTQTGCVIVRPDKTIASKGYNGFPRKMPDKPEWYKNRKIKYSRVIHAEPNAVTHSRDAEHEGYTAYTVPFAPCDRCCVHLIQEGITRFVFPSIPESKRTRARTDGTGWDEIFEKSKQYMTECGLDWTEYPSGEVFDYIHFTIMDKFKSIEP